MLRMFRLEDPWALRGIQPVSQGGCQAAFLFPQSTTQGYALHKVEDSAVQLLSFVTSASWFVNELSVILSSSACWIFPPVRTPSDQPSTAPRLAPASWQWIQKSINVDTVNDDKCSILTGSFVLLALLAPTLPSSGVCSALERLSMLTLIQLIKVSGRKSFVVSMEVVWQVFLQSEVASSLPRKAQKGCAPTCLLWRRAGWGCTPLQQQLVQQKMWSSNIGNAWKCSNDMMRETQCHHKPTIWGW